MKRIAYNIIAVIMMAAFCIFLIAGNVFRISVPVITVPGSYADEYAKSHHLESADIPDTLNLGTNLHYETFKYNVSGKFLSIEQYEGIASEIVIPYMIEGKLVTEIGEDFFSYSPDLKKVYIPITVDSILADKANGVEIVIDRDSDLLDELEEAGWNVSTYIDSDAPIFALGDIPFEYSNVTGGIKLDSYNGDDDMILIPAYINGYPVREVAFDMLGYDGVAFPDTVTSITGRVYENIYTLVFAIEFIFTIIGFVMVLLVLNLKLGKLKKAEEFVLTGPQIIVSFLYLAIQIGFAIWSIYKGSIIWLLAGLISVVMLVIYLAIVLMGGTGRKQAITVQEKIKERTSSMDDIKISVAHLADDIDDKDVKKAVSRVIEEIRYSDPTTHESMADVEETMKKAVEQLISAVSGGNSEDILKQCEITMKAVKERNERCKHSK